MAGPLTVTFTLSRAEYAAGARGELRRLVRVGAIAGAGLLAAGVAAKLDLLIAIGTIAVLAAVAAWCFPWWQWSIDESLREEEHWALDADGCTIERQAVRQRATWDFYRELVESGPVLVLLGDRGATDIVPKRVFATDADRRAFVDLVSAHVVVRERAQAASPGGWTD